MFDFAFAFRILPKLAVGAETTVFVTVASFLFALVIGLPLLVLRRSRLALLSHATSAVVNFVRSTPVLVQLYFLYFALPNFGIRLSPIATGIIAFSVHYGCYMSEAYRAGLEAVPSGQWDASTALSLPRTVTYRSIILPQTIATIIPVAGVYFIHMFKETPLLASISVVEMMFVSSEIGSDTFRYLEPITVCGLLFLLMSLCAAGLIKLAESFYGRNWKRAWS